MRRFYDTQVEEKRRHKVAEQDNDREVGEFIKDRVRTINKLTDLDNTKRMLARGNIALENQTKANIKKQKQEIMENQAKVETIKTLENNS